MVKKTFDQFTLQEVKDLALGMVITAVDSKDTPLQAGTHAHVYNLYKEVTTALVSSWYLAGARANGHLPPLD